MKTFLVAQGLVISRIGQTLEFVSRAGEEIYFQEASTGAIVTLKEDEFWQEYSSGSLQVMDAFVSQNMLLTKDESSGSQERLIFSLNEKYQADLERKLKYITKLQALGISRGQRPAIARSLNRIAEEIQDQRGIPGASTVQRWWQEYLASDCEACSLISKNLHRDRSSVVDLASNDIVEQTIDDKYAVPERPTVLGAYRDYESKLNSENKLRVLTGQKPLVQMSKRTFYRRIDARPKKEMMESREGYAAARRHFHMSQGHLPADHILDMVEIDHTPMNLFVIDDKAFLPLGRPWLTALKDRYSGMVLGFYVSFQATGLDSIFGAIKHSLYSHRKAYELWPELENPWPAHGKAACYLSDRGADFLSFRYRNAIISIGSLYEYCERRTPWLKGGIERFFLMLEQTFFEATPGRTFSNLMERGAISHTRMRSCAFLR